MDVSTALIVKTLRALHGRNQADLQTLTGLSRNVIIDIERGRRILQAKERNALERAFGVSLDTAEKTLAPLLPQSTK